MTSELHYLKNNRLFCMHLLHQVEKTLDQMKDGSAEKDELNKAYTKVMHSIVLIEKRIKELSQGNPS